MRALWRKVKRFFVTCLIHADPILLFKKIIRLNGTPHQISMGASIGVFVAFTPTIGLQMIIAGILASVLRVSKIAAILPVWISNPLTVAPILGVTYWVGRLVWPCDRFMNATEAFNNINESSIHVTDTFWMTMIGGLMVGFVCALVTYPLVRKAAEICQQSTE